MGVLGTARWNRTLCEESEYYGSYKSDRFGGGIGERDLDEGRKIKIDGTAVHRVTLFSDTHETLREWATEANWRDATTVHKLAYFTRKENMVQEAVLELVREHYVSGSSSYVAQNPVQAALFRCEDSTAFTARCDTTKLCRLPMLVLGIFDQKKERCIVDFANKRLGGSWLAYGMVQEEKIFVQRPDLGALCARDLLEIRDPTVAPVASLFSMRPNEAWILRGAPAFAEIEWYGRTPDDALDKVKLLDPADDAATSPTVIAIDAIKASFEVYEPRHLEMMLIKAYTGFAAARHDPDLGGHTRIATGSWGCGAFFNNERVMFVIQTLAAGLADVELAYHVLGDGLDLAPATAFCEKVMLENLTISEALEDLALLCETDPNWKSKYKSRRTKR